MKEYWNPMKSAQPKKEAFSVVEKSRRSFRLESVQYQVTSAGEKVHFPFSPRVDDGIVRDLKSGNVIDEILSHMPTPGTFELEIKSTGDRFDAEHGYSQMMQRLEELYPN